MSDKKYYVQARMSVTSKRGLLGEGSEVVEKDFTGGEDSIKGLLAKKVIGEKKPELGSKVEMVKKREDIKNKQAVVEDKTDEKTTGVVKK